MGRGLGERAGRSAGIALPLTVAGLAALTLGVAFSGDHRLAASGGPSDDGDLDFLCDAQERVLGTSPNLADSDGDGFSDLEEFARGTSPLAASDVPRGTAPVHLNMSAYAGADGKIHVLCAVYSSDLSLSDTGLQLGFQTQRTVAVLSDAWVAMHSTSILTGTANGQGLIQLLDLPVDPTVVQNLGRLTLWARGYMLRGPAAVSAAAANLVTIDGAFVLAMANPRPTNLQAGQVPSSPGSIYVPLPVGGSMPSTWSAGEICFQRSSPVAVQGAMITQEVVSADCLAGWDGYCPPSCVSTVGSTYTTVDPIGLIGG